MYHQLKNYRSQITLCLSCCKVLGQIHGVPPTNVQMLVCWTDLWFSSGIDFLLFFFFFIFMCSFKPYEEGESRNKWIDKWIKANLCWKLKAMISNQHNEHESFIPSSVFLEQFTEIQELVTWWWHGKWKIFPTAICFKEKWQRSSPGLMYCSDKIHCDTGNTLTWTVFSGNRPTALISSGQIRKAGRNDLFLCNFTSSNSTLHPVVSQAPVLTNFQLQKSEHKAPNENKGVQALPSPQQQSDHLSRALLLPVPINLPAHTWESFCSCFPHYLVLAGFPSSVVFFHSVFK